MKALKQSEVAEIIKKDVPRLLHKRIAELESELNLIIGVCDGMNDIHEAKHGYRVESADNAISKADEILKKEII